MSLNIPVEKPKQREGEAQLSSVVIKKDSSSFEDCLKDASNFKGEASSQYIPHSEIQIIQILKELADKKTPITLQGARTGLAGGAVPQGGVILSLDRLNKYSEINSGVISVEPGVILKDLQDYAESKGFLYAPDPTERMAQVGATVSTNASGCRTFKYGATRPHVKRIRFCLTSGDVLDIERGKFLMKQGETVQLNLSSGITKFEPPTYVMPPIKNAAGYYSAKEMDLIDLLIGSEGTLGVISEMDLTVVSAPEKSISLLIFFSNEEEAFNFVIQAREMTYETRKNEKLGLEARSIEYFDWAALDLVRHKFPQLSKAAKCAVFVEQEVTSESEEVLLEKWFQLLEKSNAIEEDSWAGLTHDIQEQIREFRHELPVQINEIMTRRGMRKIATDMAVADNHLKTLMNYYRNTIEASGLESAIFGHIGNNHVHVNLLPKNKEEFDQALIIYQDWVKKVIELKGTVSAEHGIGKIKVPYLEMMYGPEVIQQMVQIKKAFDPAGLLGRGNIFKEDYL